MRRFLLGLLLLGVLALAAAGVAVWRGDRGSVSAPISGQPALGPGRMVGQSALSHGGVPAQPAQDHEKAGSAPPLPKDQGDHRRPAKPDGGKP